MPSLPSFPPPRAPRRPYFTPPPPTPSSRVWPSPPPLPPVPPAWPSTRGPRGGVVRVGPGWGRGPVLSTPARGRGRLGSRTAQGVLPWLGGVPAPTQLPAPLVPLTQTTLGLSSAPLPPPSTPLPACPPPRSAAVVVEAAAASLPPTTCPPLAPVPQLRPSTPLALTVWQPLGPLGLPGAIPPSPPPRPLPA